MIEFARVITSILLLYTIDIKDWLAYVGGFAQSHFNIVEGTLD